MHQVNTVPIRAESHPYITGIVPAKAGVYDVIGGAIRRSDYRTLIGPKIAWIGRVQGWVGHEPDGRNLAAESRNRIVEMIRTVKIQDVWLPKKTGETWNRIRGPCRRVGKYRGSGSPKDLVGRGFGQYALSGPELVIPPVANNQSGGIVSAEVTP